MAFLAFHRRRRRNAAVLLSHCFPERLPSWVCSPRFVFNRCHRDGDREALLMRIALIAMSGVRVVDPELLRLGLTLPGFVERSKVIASLPSLGLLTLAGMTPASHRITYIEVPDLRAVNEIPLGFDLVA